MSTGEGKRRVVEGDVSVEAVRDVMKALQQKEAEVGGGGGEGVGWNDG